MNSLCITSLQLRPPVNWEYAGQYVCLPPSVFWLVCVCTDMLSGTSPSRRSRSSRTSRRGNHSRLNMVPKVIYASHMCISYPTGGPLLNLQKTFCRLVPLFWLPSRLWCCVEFGHCVPFFYRCRADCIQWWIMSVLLSSFLLYLSLCLGIYGGQLLGVRSTNSLAFYAWDSLELVRRIMIVPQKVYWSESGELLAICTEESFFILRYDQSSVDQAFEHKEDVEEDGVEAAFDVIFACFALIFHVVSPSLLHLGFWMTSHTLWSHFMSTCLCPLVFCPFLSLSASEVFGIGCGAL